MKQQPAWMIELVLCLAMIATTAGIVYRYDFMFHTYHLPSRYFQVIACERKSRVVVGAAAYSCGRLYWNFDY